MREVRVRFAPSPTGALHIGGARTALFNWLFARRHGGSFVLRIEDTDAVRSTDQAIAWITDALTWLGLDWDEGPDAGGEFGPYLQSRRQDLYRRYADSLLEQDRAYRCFCTPAELEARRDAQRQAGRVPRYEGTCAALTADEVATRLESGQSFALRLKVPASGEIIIPDLIRGDVTFDSAVFDDFVIMKSDGMPTYNYACVIDDATMRISHVIRGEEHLSNTPKQVFVFNALNLSPPLYAHVPMILAPDRSKLSKRHGATSVEEFRTDGYLAPALNNYLAMLGWSPSHTGEEVFSLDELVPLFDLSDVVRTAAVYDVNKLTWLNAHYIRDMDRDELIQQLIPFLSRLELPTDGPALDTIRGAVELMRSRSRTLVELAAACSYYLHDVDEYDDKGWRKYVASDESISILERARDLIADMPDFNAEALEARYRELADELSIKTSPLFHGTRVALTGRTVGASLFDTMELLGRETCLRRLDRAIQRARG